MKLIILIAILTLIGCGSENEPGSENDSKVCMCNDFKCVRFEPDTAALDNCINGGYCTTKINNGATTTRCEESGYDYVRVGFERYCYGIKDSETGVLWTVSSKLCEGIDPTKIIVIKNSNSN